MKTKRIIYFLSILLGATIMGIGERHMQKEYALCLGMVLLMSGIYGSIRSWNIGRESEQMKNNMEDGV